MAESELVRELRAQLLLAVQDRDIYKSIALDRERTILSLAADRDAWKRKAHQAAALAEQVLEESEPVMHFADGKWQPEKESG